jgi:lipoprotein-anchoring transpeptidase ErfK/SrfK
VRCDSLLKRRGFLALGAAASVAACAPGISVGPAPTFEPIEYAARQDGAHVIPAVPIEEVPAWLRRQVVPFETEEVPGSIVIVSENGLLHLVLPDGYALRYGLGVGREGLGWTGEAEIYRTARWPGWTPTPSMIARDPSLERWAEGQPGGPRNPLGARALYLRTIASGADEGIRIHGTPEWRSIGYRASSGCFRMINHDVVDLFGRVERGARVVVL